MNTRIFNVKILTMKAGERIFDGEVWIMDDTEMYV